MPQDLPGIDWTLRVDKGEAAKYGASPISVGTAVQLVTNGVKVTEYRPNDTDKSVDVLVRFPPDRRSLDQLDALLTLCEREARLLSAALLVR